MRACRLDLCHNITNKSNKLSLDLGYLGLHEDISHCSGDTACLVGKNFQLLSSILCSLVRYRKLLLALGKTILNFPQIYRHSNRVRNFR